MFQRRYRPEYKPPAVDSPRALANATMFLVGTRTLEHLTADKLAHQYRLKPKTAEYLLGREVARRGK
jgi:hypothetical protein